MARKEVTEGAAQTPAANPAVDEFARFTWSVRGWQESLTIRCDSEEELKQLRDRWSPVINPPRLAPPKHVLFASPLRGFVVEAPSLPFLNTPLSQRSKYDNEF